MRAVSLGVFGSTMNCPRGPSGVVGLVHSIVNWEIAAGGQNQNMAIDVADRIKDFLMTLPTITQKLKWKWNPNTESPFESGHLI
jgi:hypothetical protein